MTNDEQPKFNLKLYLMNGLLKMIVRTHASIASSDAYEDPKTHSELYGRREMGLDLKVHTLGNVLYGK